MRTLSFVAVAAVGMLLLAAGSCKDPNETGEGTGGNVSGSDRCEPICEDFAMSGCGNGTDYDGCMITCLALTSSSSCRSSADDYFDCSDSTTVECNAWDQPHYPTCGDEWLIAVGCAVTENPNEAVEQPCDEACDAIQVADCDYTKPKQECYNDCLWWGATGTGCDDEWADYLDCANSVTMECLFGVAVAPGCGPEYGAYWECLDAIGN